jgi:hypothetical protein
MLASMSKVAQIIEFHMNWIFGLYMVYGLVQVNQNDTSASSPPEPKLHKNLQNMSPSLI